ncbi:MAG: hypothetical protein A2073_02175 [Deltaproteobacteria bacterium GWC2_42_11]|nr:MAG: hypothetical protein A2073_02175 [Deltaproteobacteria bacterium GWC2_42_11]
MKKRGEILLSREKGTIFKPWGNRLKVALVYPNTYNVGICNLGFQTIYERLNSLDYVVCERVFLPDANISVSSLESARPLQDFDVLAFSISFEQDYLNILKTLELARIPFLSSHRGGNNPLLIAGGAAIFLNPEPIADFFDAFVIGEGEDVISELFGIIRTCKWGHTDRLELKKELSSIEGVYIPAFYNITYCPDNRIDKVIPLYNAPEKVKKRRVEDINKYPIHSVITTPYSEFRNTELIEVSRGCGKGCRFCAAGFIYLPPRERSKEVIMDSVIKGIDKTGKVGLVGAAVSEYSGLKDVCRQVIDIGGEATLSSLRLDVIDKECLLLLKGSGYKTITLAPEAGSDRLRDVINKCISDEEIFNAASLISEAGMNKVKLYFMIGLPTESDYDIEAIVLLVKKIRGIIKKGEITLKVNPFIPKPWTPFQWSPYAGIGVLQKRLKIVKRGLAIIKGIRVNFLSPREGYAQTYLSMGDRRLRDTLITAHYKGWREAFRKAEPLPDFFVNREKRFEEVLPWDFIDHGIKKRYLWDEYQRALKDITTPPCNVGRCTRCGVCLMM